MLSARIHQRQSIVAAVGHRLLVLAGAVVLTLAFFIVLPVMQTISKPPTSDLILQTVDMAQLEPPPPAPPVEEEPEPEPEPEDAPPELVENAPPLDLSQLELALNPGLSDGWSGGADFSIKLNAVSAGGGEDAAAIFSMADLDQKPQAIYQPRPSVPSRLRRRTPATVKLIYIVDERGRVVDPRVRSSTDPEFDKVALSTVKRWKYEPGKRGGKAVRFRVLQPITFPKG
jgi:protein TonB